MSELKMSNILGSKLKVDGHRAAVLLDGEVIAKCASKSIAIEIASKANNHNKLVEENKRLRDAIHKACSESCNIATCGTIMMSADLFNGLVDAYNGCEETKERED